MNSKVGFQESGTVILKDSAIAGLHQGKPMSARKFIMHSVIGLLILLCLSMAVHIALDIYGLYLPVKGKELPVFHQERISKYLLAHRYIPQNYNTIILGTSLSDNLDISSYNEGNGKYRIYNASMMGANISEIRPIAEKAIEGGIRNVIFCISPYQMKNSGAKEVELNSRIYLGSLGSKNLYETYAIALIRHLELMPAKFPKKHINEHGVNFFTERFRAKDVEERIAQVAAVHRGTKLIIDPAALAELKMLIKLFEDNNINYLAYFHPIPARLMEAQLEEHLKFQNLIGSIIGDDRKILNFNDSSFHSFTTDHNNYIDNGHLSERGQAVITQSLYTKLSSGN